MNSTREQPTCDRQLLALYVDNRLAEATNESVELHIADCAACRETLEAFSASRETWECARVFLPVDEYDCLGSATRVDAEPRMLAREIQGWLDPADDAQYLGRFAGYEILGVIGHGGMGIVLKGAEHSLNRFVAIKILAPRLATDITARKRFEREAQAAAAVLHENVVAIHRVDQWHGLPFLVMPYLGGISLQARMDQDGPLAIEQVLRVGGQIAAGLAAAHAQGLVHRDVKPANVLLNQGVERVAITDFGLARAVDDVSLTRTGMIAGTPEYMSPEQAAGASVDHRSDLFSLGSVLYALASGQRPFSGDDAQQVLDNIVECTPTSLSVHDARIPFWFAELVQRLHEKSPKHRFQSAVEVSELLNAWLAHLQQPDVVEAPKRIKRYRAKSLWLTSATAIAMCALFAGIVGLPVLLPPTRGTLRIDCICDSAPIEIIRGEDVVKRLTVTPSGIKLRMPAGSYVVRTALQNDGITIRNGNVELRDGKTAVVHVVHADNQAHSTPALKFVRRFVGHQNAVHDVAFTPDGKRAISVGAYGTHDVGYQMNIWDIAWGRLERPIKGTAEMLCVSVAPNGTHAIVGSASLNAELWDLRSGKLLREYTLPAGTMTCAVAFVGDNLIIGANNGTDAGGRPTPFCVWNAQDAKVLNSTNGPPGGYRRYVDATRSGHRFAVAAENNNEVWLIDAQTMEVRHRLRGQEGSIRAIDFAPNGKTLLAASCDGSISLWDVETGKQVSKIVGHDSCVMAAEFSPAGHFIASSDESGAIRVWSVEATNHHFTTREPIFEATTAPKTANCLAWAPNGKSILTGGGSALPGSEESDFDLRLWELPSHGQAPISKNAN